MNKEELIEVVLTFPVTTIHVKDVITRKFYGVLFNDGSKGFVTKVAGTFYVKSLLGLTTGDVWVIDGYDLPTVIQKTINQGHRVYEFYYSHQLVTWLAE